MGTTSREKKNVVFKGTRRDEERESLRGKDVVQGEESLKSLTSEWDKLLSSQQA